jgi:hypothetical protein
VTLGFGEKQQKFQFSQVNSFAFDLKCDFCKTSVFVDLVHAKKIPRNDAKPRIGLSNMYAERCLLFRNCQLISLHQAEKAKWS